MFKYVKIMYLYTNMDIPCIYIVLWKYHVSVYKYEKSHVSIYKYGHTMYLYTNIEIPCIYSQIWKYHISMYKYEKKTCIYLQIWTYHASVYIYEKTHMSIYKDGHTMHLYVQMSIPDTWGSAGSFGGTVLLQSGTS